jgi:hypothetical protein
MRQITRTSALAAMCGTVGLLSGLPSALAQGQSTTATPSISSQKQARPAPGKAPTAEPEKKPSKFDEPMKFARVRAVGTDCTQNCPEWISAEGKIIAGSTASQLRRIVNSLGNTKLPIFIASGGGSVEEGYAMARFIRSKGLSVSVTRTELTDCQPTDKDCKALGAKGIRLGTAKPHLAPCASSCVFVLAGGVQRHVGPFSYVGVHQFEARVTHVKVLQKYRMVPNGTGELVKEIISEERVAQRTEKTATRAEVYDKSAAFFREMGVNDAIMVPLKATPHSTIHWLSREEIAATKIATDRKNGLQILGMSTNLPGLSTGPSPPSAGVSPSDPCQQFGPSSPQCAALSAAAATTLPVARTPVVADPRLVRAIQEQLKSANCLGGGVVGFWGDRSKRAVTKFAAAAKLKLDGAKPTDAMLAEVRSYVTVNPRVCETPED